MRPLWLVRAGTVPYRRAWAWQRALVERFRDARLVVLPGTGHLTHYERPAEVAAAIAEFVR